VRALATALVAAVGLTVVPSPAATQPRLQGVGTFVRPVHVAAAPADHERLYVVEQRGMVQVVRNGQAQPFLDLRAVVRSPEDAGGGNEEGLLSIAFPQDFQQSRRFYVYFTDNAGNNRVEEFVAPSGDAADPASGRPVIVLDHPVQENHNGGQLQFGPDGMLYLAPGDGGGGNDPDNNAENLGSPLGKLLRIDPRASGALAYTIPPDNPFVGRPGARGEVWSYGLRNPFRFSFDRLTGDLVIGDVGQGTTEEIDFAPASQGRGRGLDFGWDDC
jgi:glucose/arabinose dehydrogenase